MTGVIETIAAADRASKSRVSYVRASSSARNRDRNHASIAFPLLAFRPKPDHRLAMIAGIRGPDACVVQAMGILRAIWVDFCRIPQPQGLILAARHHGDVLRVTMPEAVSSAIRGHRAQFISVEYDYPDLTHLMTVPLVRREFPALPVLMLTEYHSEALSIWAYRSRVWDYRVKPVDETTLARLFEAMARARISADHDGWLAQPFPSDLIAPAGHLRRPLIAAPHTAAAVAYISEHYAEACRIETIAGLCHLSESEFSRVFHREHGVSFRRFLLQYRIAKARDFLAEPQASVSQVAYAVGFNDLSHFGRMFRRIVGMPATHYQRNLRVTEQPAAEMKISLHRAESFHSTAARF